MGKNDQRTALVNELGHEKICLISYVNNKGADQPVHPRSLISAFVVRWLDSIISLLRNFKILASFCGCAGRFVSVAPEDKFRHVVAQIYCQIKEDLMFCILVHW